MNHSMTTRNITMPNNKKWLMVILAAAALTLSACGKKDAPPMETEPTVDAQTQVEQEATGVAMANDDVAVASADNDTAIANDGMTTTDNINDDVAVATAEDTVIIDGTENE